MPGEPTKVCTHCHISKPVRAFHQKQGGTFGRAAYCADCKRLEYIERRKRERAGVAPKPPQSPPAKLPPRRRSLAQAKAIVHAVNAAIATIGATRREEDQAARAAAASLAETMPHIRWQASDGRLSAGPRKKLPAHEVETAHVVLTHMPLDREFVMPLLGELATARRVEQAGRMHPWHG